MAAPPTVTSQIAFFQSRPVAGMADMLAEQCGFSGFTAFFLIPSPDPGYNTFKFACRHGLGRIGIRIMAGKFLALDPVIQQVPLYMVIRPERKVGIEYDTIMLRCRFQNGAVMLDEAIVPDRDASAVQTAFLIKYRFQIQG